MTQGKIKLYSNSWNTIAIPTNKKVKEYLVSKKKRLFKKTIKTRLFQILLRL